MRPIQVNFTGNNSLTTMINGTRAEIEAYYLGNLFNLGPARDGSDDDMQTALSVLFLPDLENPILLKPKGEAPEAIMRISQDYGLDIYLSWRGRLVEPYGRLIDGYGSEAPYNRPHVRVRLASALPINGDGVSVCAIDELPGCFDLDAIPDYPTCINLSMIKVFL